MLEDVLITLDIMWKGMFGIFSVILIITLIVILIQKFEQKLPDKASEKEQ